MLSRCLSTSILTVHFKRQLSSSSVLSQSSQLAPKLALSTHSSLLRCRLGDARNFCITLSFCHSVQKLSAKSGHPNEAKQAHGHMVKLGLYDTIYLQNQILNAYVKCKEFGDADKLFDEMRLRNLVTWNILICGVTNRGGDNKYRTQMGFYYLMSMLLNKVGLDQITCNCLIRACTQLNDIEAGRQLHCIIEKQGFNLNCFVSSALLDFYGKCGFVVEARRIFDEVLNRDLVLWNTIISSYVLNGLDDEAFDLFRLMGSDGLKGDAFTFSSLLSACGSEMAKQIHCFVIKQSFEHDIPVATSLVDMYAKRGDINDARRCFDAMVAKNVMSWNTIIVGYGQHGDGQESMRLLREMLWANSHPDELTFSSILSSCGNTSAFWEIVQVQSFLIKKGFEAFSSIANALINAYSKSGSLAQALICFNLVEKPNLVSWTAVIGALAFHGFAKESIEMFERMLSHNVRPDRIAFLEVLSACSHGGFLHEGLHYFKMMTNLYKIEPSSEHYTCLIDLLGRAGFLDEAFDLLKSTSFELRSNMLGAFVGACKVHGNGKLAKWAVEKLVEMEPDKLVNYALLSNVYASEGLWNEAAQVRETMKQLCDHKAAGRSWVEIVGGSICT